MSLTGHGRILGDHKYPEGLPPTDLPVAYIIGHNDRDWRIFIENRIVYYGSSEQGARHWASHLLRDHKVSAWRTTTLVHENKNGAMVKHLNGDEEFLSYA